MTLVELVANNTGQLLVGFSALALRQKAGKQLVDSETKCKHL